MTAPIELFYWPTPNGWKASILLEELNLPYNVNWIDISKGDQFDPEFLKIAPNNRMPAIIDPDGPGGAPISIFESGAILLYLARKHGQFLPVDDRGRVEVEQWLMWQMGGLGPMAGQAHHFLQYAPEDVPYGKTRYRNEVNRLYGVLNRRLEGRDYVAGDYSIADMAIWPWAILWERQDQNVPQDFPNVAAWLERVGARPAAQKGRGLGAKDREEMNLRDDKGAQSVLFGQTAR